VILIDQLKQVYIDGELESVDTTNFFPKMMRKDYSVGLNLQGAGAESLRSRQSADGSGHWSTNSLALAPPARRLASVALPERPRARGPIA